MTDTDRTCATCRHWRRDAESAALGLLRGSRRCNRLEDSGAVWADVWEKAGIYTLPTFGCSLWERQQ